MEGGKIVEAGPPGELMANTSGKLHALVHDWRRQEMERLSSLGSSHPGTPGVSKGGNED